MYRNREEEEDEEIPPYQHKKYVRLYACKCKCMCVCVCTCALSLYLEDTSLHSQNFREFSASSSTPFRTSTVAMKDPGNKNTETYKNENKIIKTNNFFS